MSKAAKRYVFGTGAFLLLFTRERGSDNAKLAVLKHEEGIIEIYIHPNNLAEAYAVLNRLVDEKPEILAEKVKPADIVKSAYATLNVLNDEETVLKLGELKTKYRNKPWGDLSTAALSLRLNAPAVILDNEKYFDDIEEVSIIRISELKI